MDQFVVRMYQTQFKFYRNDNDNSRMPFNFWMMMTMSTSNLNDGVKSATDTDHLSLWVPRWVHCSKQCFCRNIQSMGMCPLIARFMGQHGAHLGPTGPRWAPCWPHELCYLGQQKLQAGLDIHEGLTAQKYIEEIVRPHVKPHVDNHAQADSTVFMRGLTKPHTSRIVLTSVTNLLLSANLWSIMPRNTIGMNLLP